MNIRKMTAQDAKALATLETLCFSEPWSAQAFLDECANEHACFFVCEEDGEAVGYAGMMTVLDEGYITNVAVHPEKRRRHMADDLIKALTAEAKARALSFMTLEVRASNEGAIALYRKHGFLSSGRRRDFYQKPKEDALLMTLRFEKRRQTD